MRTVLVLLCFSIPAFGQTFKTLTLIDGKTVRVPCEVRANIGVKETTPALQGYCPKCGGDLQLGDCVCEVTKAAKCKRCGDSCSCVGGCGCEAADAARVERPRNVVPPLPPVVVPALDTPLWIDWRNGTRTLGTVGSYIAAGGDPAKIRTAPVVAPVATPMPVVMPVPTYRPAVGFNVYGPFGGGVSVGACGPGG